MLSPKHILRNKPGRSFAMPFLLTALLLAAAACDVEPDGGPRFNLDYEMVRIEAGTFTMGSPADEPERQPYGTNETQHPVTFTQAFYIGEHELTQTQYEKVMGEGSDYSYFTIVEGFPPEPGEAGSRPVECITWYEVIVFCNTLSRKERLTPAYSIDGKTNPASWGRLPRRNNDKWDAVVWNKSANGFRLPTEAEWEYACRAGTETPFWSGAADTSLEGKANVSDNTLIKEKPDLEKLLGFTDITDGYGNITAPVKSFAGNPFGLYDMHGNVAEWCWDWYGRYPSGAQTDPSGPDSGDNRVVRGGSWSSTAGAVRSAARGGRSSPSQNHTGLGFRLARNGN